MQLRDHRRLEEHDLAIGRRDGHLVGEAHPLSNKLALHRGQEVADIENHLITLHLYRAFVAALENGNNTLLSGTCQRYPDFLKCIGCDEALHNFTDELVYARSNWGR